MSDDYQSRLGALAETALKLARTAPSGQLALARLAEAIDPAWLSGPWAKGLGGELQSALDAASEPIEFKVIERTLREAWGTAPKRELDDLQREPIATTPIAQVHRGTLDGDPVAVKVLRPAIAGRVRQDLALLDALARPLDAALPALDAGRVLAEIRERALDELDLESEADVQRRVHRALRDHPTLQVVAPIGRLCHHTVVVTPWVAGVPLDETAGADRNRAAALYAAFVIGGAPGGTVHAAPTRRDALLLPDGRLAVLDFGAAGVTDPDRIRTTLSALDALQDRDGRGFAAALAELGALPASSGAAALKLALAALGPHAAGEPTRLDEDAIRAGGERLGPHVAELAELGPRVVIAPQDLWPLRGVAQVFGAIARSGGAEADWLSIARAALRDGWDAARDIDRFLP